MSVTNTTRASKQPATTITSSLSSLSGKRKYLDEHEVAERLGLSVQFVRKQRYERRPPHYCKFGNRVRYPIAEVERYEAAALQVDEAPVSRLPAAGGAR